MRPAPDHRSVRPASGGRPPAAAPGLAAWAAALVLAACGGGGPIGNPPNVANTAVAGGQSLSFAYFQRCIQPILQASLQVNLNGTVSTNTCAAGGCHDNSTGTGGAFRVVQGATLFDLSDPANTPTVLRASPMYRNFYSAQGETVPGQPGQSRLINKPRLNNVLHGGGLIFLSDQDPDVRLLRYWINHPAPLGQNEFSPAFNTLFTPPDPNTGSCNSA